MKFNWRQAWGKTRMIRRELRLFDTTPQWLLISQVEHARLSTVLAERCIAHFGQAVDTIADASDLDGVRHELLQAMHHHDDGWAAWESQGHLDEQHRPPSFRELSPAEDVPIWTGSIESAASCGPLAGAVVASHFLSLHASSEKEDGNPAVTRWQAETSEQRSDWLQQWQRIDPELHTTALADEALHWLQLFDVMSLWLCCACPGAGEQVAEWPQPYQVQFGESLRSEFRCQEPTEPGKQPRVTIEPWLFDRESVDISATGWTLPIAAYHSRDQLADSCSPHQIRWRLESPR